MGESKRRQQSLGEKYGQEQPILSWLPITKRQADQFMTWTTRGAWIGIGSMVAFWVILRVVGPGLGWWNLPG